MLDFKLYLKTVILLFIGIGNNIKVWSGDCIAHRTIRTGVTDRN